jgi:NADH-quinone oxidoreductase subunit L
MTHALFKALLFLAAGAVIVAMREEHDLFAMGGLAKKMPFTFTVFLIGALGLTALPLVTAGFSSKDLILAAEWGSGGTGRILWAIGVAGVFLTSGYTFRMIFFAFFGAPRAAPSSGGRMGLAIMLPLAVLAGLCVVAGLVNFPGNLGGSPYFTGFLETALPRGGPLEGAGLTEGGLELISLGASLAGIPFAYLLYRLGLRKIRAAAQTGAVLEPRGMTRFFFSGWGFDFLYARIFVRPFLWIAGLAAGDIVNTLWEGVGGAARRFSRILRLTQTGRIRWYAAALAAGGLLIAAVLVLL